MYEYVLSELEPWCLAEQDFCVRFFNLTTAADENHAQVIVQFSAQISSYSVSAQMATLSPSQCPIIYYRHIIRLALLIIYIDI